MTRNAENLTVGQVVGAASGNRYFMMSFPATRCVVASTGMPVKYLPTSPGTMSATASSTFASSARALPGCENGRIGKSHILLSFLQRKLTKCCYDGIITMHVSALSKPLVLLTAVVSASWRRLFVFMSIVYHISKTSTITLYVEKVALFRHVLSLR